MELNDFIMRYNFGKPMRLKVYRYRPFRIAFTGYVVDGKLVDDYGVTVRDINALDRDYSIFDFGIDDGELVVSVSPKYDRP